MKKCQFLVLFCLVVGLILAAGQPCRADKQLSMFGISLGMNQARVKEKLGLPLMEYKKNHSWAYRNVRGAVRGQEDPTIFFNKANRVQSILGSRIELGGKTIAKRGDNFSKLSTALGKGYKLAEEQYANVYTYKAYDLAVVVDRHTKMIVVISLGRSAMP